MADTRTCPSCAMEIDAAEKTCPICGYEPPHQKKSVQYAAWLMALLLLWPAIEGVMYLIDLL